MKAIICILALSLVLLTKTTTQTTSPKYTIAGLLRKAPISTPVNDKQCPGSIFEAYFNEFPTGKYVIEEHTATTPDGYNLKMFRVNLSQEEKAKLQSHLQPNTKRTVLMIHGLGDSADVYTFTGTEVSSGIYIINKGFDVWFANNRGNKYSHSHINPNITEAEFFDFSWEDMGKVDVPTFYTYILKATTAEKLITIGYSQGSTQMFVALLDDESREFIQAKTEKAILMAPVVFLNYCEDATDKFFANFREIIYHAASNLGVYDFMPSSCSKHEVVGEIAQWACQKYGYLCEGFVKNIIGLDTNVSSFQNYFKRALAVLPAGGSSKSFVHYAQQINEKTPKVFRKFDYGFFGNIKKYRSPFAPIWDFKVWNTPVALLAGTADILASQRDVTNVSTFLNPDLVNIYYFKDYQHQTFACPKDTSRLHEVFDKEMGIASVVVVASE